MTASAEAGPWIQHVAEAVAEEVQPDHGWERVRQTAAASPIAVLA